MLLALSIYLMVPFNALICGVKCLPTRVISLAAVSGDWHIPFSSDTLVIHDLPCTFCFNFSPMMMLAGLHASKPVRIHGLSTSSQPRWLAVSTHVPAIRCLMHT
jgi:hypothetical protein